MGPARKLCSCKTATRLMAPANEGVAGGLCLLSSLPEARGGAVKTTDSSPAESRCRVSTDNSLVELPCGVTVVREDTVLLLVHGHDGRDWVLPGSDPHWHERSGSCARQGIDDESVVDVQPAGCAVIAGTDDPPTRRNGLELVVAAATFATDAALEGERRRQPRRGSWDDWSDAAPHPCMAGCLWSLARRYGSHARYLGNLRRPGRPGH